jgi:hypothetical protein
MLYNEKRLQEGDLLEQITITAGPSMFEFMLSCITGKEVPIAIKESERGYPHNNFDAQFYGCEVGNTSYNYLNYRIGKTDNGKDLLSSNHPVPWKVKVAIRSKLLDNTVHWYVHYEGTYDVVKGQGSLILIKEPVKEFA